MLGRHEGRCGCWLAPLLRHRGVVLGHIEAGGGRGRRGGVSELQRAVRRG